MANTLHRRALVATLTNARVRMAVYTALLAVTASGTAVALISSGYGIGSTWVVVVLASIAAVAERGTVRLSSNLEESISLLPILFAAVLFGPLAAMVVAVASMAADLLLAPAVESPYQRWAVYTSSRSIIAAATGLIATFAATLPAGNFGRVALATFLGAATAQSLDVFFASLTVRLRGSGRMIDAARTLAPVVLAAVPLYAPVVVLLAVAYQELSPWTLILFFAPALAAQRLFALYQEQRRLSESLYGANIRLERANLSFATALVVTLDARDRYTAGHSAAVAIYSRDIAARMEMSDDEQQLVHLCGLVHDIGKIGLSAGLLEKAGPLTLEERRQMQEHSAIGERILSKVESYSEIARIVRHHHERVDGNGYPDGLASEEIPLLSRIIAVADAYNAMTSDRPYRDAMPSRVARMRLAQAVESQFDTSVVAAFEAILAGADDAYRIGTRADFDLELQDAASSDPARLAGAA